VTCPYLFLILTAVVRVWPKFTGRTAPLRTSATDFRSTSLKAVASLDNCADDPWRPVVRIG